MLAKLLLEYIDIASKIYVRIEYKSLVATSIKDFAINSKIYKITWIYIRILINNTEIFRPWPRVLHFVDKGF